VNRFRQRILDSLAGLTRGGTGPIALDILIIAAVAGLGAIILSQLGSGRDAEVLEAQITATPTPGVVQADCEIPPFDLTAGSSTLLSFQNDSFSDFSDYRIKSVEVLPVSTDARKDGVSAETRGDLDLLIKAAPSRNRATYTLSLVFGSESLDFRSDCLIEVSAPEPSPSPSGTPGTITPTVEPTAISVRLSAPQSASPSATPIPSQTPTPPAFLGFATPTTPIPTSTLLPTRTPDPTQTPRPTRTPQPSPTPITPSPTSTSTFTPIPTPTFTPTETPTETATPTDTPTDVPAPEDTPTDVPTPEDTPTD
jgi:hypothetical protein